MNSCLTIIAKINAKNEKTTLVKTELLKLIETTKAEKGCIQYDLHQDNNDPTTFIFFERWENYELWNQHMNNPHLKAYIKATEGAINSFTIHEMTVLE